MSDSVSTSQSADKSRTIRVGISTRHGMADEIAAFPPEGIEYCFPEPTRRTHRFIRSPLKCYLWEFAQKGEFDILEAYLSPVITESPWICSLDCFPAAVAFNLLGAPIPRAIRLAFINRLFRQDQCRKIVFWSEAARRTMLEYGRVRDPKILDKTTVVYPAIREVPDYKIRYSDDQINLLFSGDFFRKGGANVVDVFEQLQPKFPGIKLRVCCDEKIDFNTPNRELRGKYLEKIRSNSAIIFGRVSRQEMLETILPETSVYLLPTYNEAFGFAILEAMAYGIPVIATNQFAIPEMIEHEQSGLLIDMSQYNTQKMFRGYVVDKIPDDFRGHINEQLILHLSSLIESANLRKQIGDVALSRVRTKFGFEARNRTMGTIYCKSAE